MKFLARNLPGFNDMPLRYSLLDEQGSGKQDKAAVDAPELAGITVRALPLYMTSLAATATIARAALDLAQDLRG